MFTGLVSSVGVVENVATTPVGLELAIACDYPDLVEGESVAVNGACLTVIQCKPGLFSVAAVNTTLERTTIGSWVAGKRVNLERALRQGDRLGGHFLLGHVDCVGRVVKVEHRGDAVLVNVHVPAEIEDLRPPLGSMALDGVSLTVNAVPSRGTVQASLIDYTVSHTTLAKLTSGDDVHVEADVIGKHVRQLLAPYLVALGTLRPSE
jgi:riboflavin synthase